MAWRRHLAGDNVIISNFVAIHSLLPSARQQNRQRRRAPFRHPRKTLLLMATTLAGDNLR
jgi:hypothetical protein